MSQNNHEARHRRSIRLEGYDYSQAGAYFITICTHARACLFGAITNGEMRMNEFGQIVLREWERSGQIRSEISLDEFVVMPNHIHAVLFIVAQADGIEADVRADNRTPIAGADDRAPVVVGAHSRAPVAGAENRAPIAGADRAPVAGAENRAPVVVGAHSRAPLRRPRSLGSFVAGYKSAVTAQINQIRKTPFVPVWQRNYYEHIIRNEQDLDRIRGYIVNNPSAWKEDDLFEHVS